ncbi:unnamed protein product [Paramecium sonneborni]|uniref:RING-type E3 ubiquitin transferase n=1 Tax=Paramecium sonneborni TaxID=65129 RepID=A0A8S1LCJ5_9CILI|nr:unnamed protein product [Paramecium sonneborni]
MDILNGEDHILKVSNEIDKYEDEEFILTILNITSQEYRNKIKKFKGYGSKKLCANVVGKQEMFYQCFDCSIDTNHIICKECFIPEIHKNHAVFFEQIHSQMPGFCDCGDTMIFEANSMCPKHQPVLIKFGNQQLYYDKIAKNYEQFLMIAFSLLQKKLSEIIDYPADLLENIENIIKGLKNDTLMNYYNSEKIHFQSIQNSMNQAKLIHRLILRCLEIIITDNIIWGSLTGKILRQEYKFKINNKIITSISLLELYIKNHAYLVESLKLDQDISTFFPVFFQEDDFRNYLNRIVIRNFKNFYLFFHSYKLKTINNEEFKFQIYQRTNDKKLNILIQQILHCSQIKQIQCDNIIISSALMEKFYSFIQSCYVEILKLYQKNRTPISYKIFDDISDLFLKISFINSASLDLFYSIFYFLGLMLKCKQGLKGLVNQIQEILSKDFHYFQSQILSPNSPEFQKLLHQSLLIYSLTRSCPCQQNKDLTLESQTDEMDEQSLNCLFLQLIMNLSSFRCNLKSMLLAIGHLQSYEVQNIQRIILHYFLNNLVTTFNLNYYQSQLQLFLSNLVLSDRNFITVLTIYIMNFSNSKEAYNDILQISGKDNQQLKLIMFHILKRAILNYYIFSDYQFYQGKQADFDYLEGEIALQQADVAYIQIYAYLFQEQGINDIIQCFQEIESHLKQKENLALLICKIAQTDNDLIQCVESFIDKEKNVQLQKGLHKLFQTIFYSQTFYQLNEMKSILQSFSNINYKGFESFTLSSCERNQDNGQLQLKKELKLPIYEPIYAFQNQYIKETISDKLQMQNDKFAELFGSSLEFELQNYNTDKSTLTNIRYEILKGISVDNQQYLLDRILNDLESTFQSNMEFDIIVDQLIKILQNNAIYINLLILSNSFFKASNIIIQNSLDKIYLYCQDILSSQQINYTQTLFFQVYCQRLENKNITQKLNEPDNKQQSKSQKHQQYKQQLQQQFYQMQQDFNSKINNNQQLIEDTDETCLLCKLPFEKEDLQYQPILIQYTNIYQYLDIIQLQNTSETNFLSVHIQNCNHIFHDNCLKKQIYSLNEKDLKFQQCPLCYSPYNFLFPSSYQRQNIEIQQFEFSIQVFLESLFNSNLEIFENKYKNELFDILSFLDEILSEILCNLTFQLLSDFETFIKKNQHLFIQKIIDLMKWLYQNFDTNFIENIKLSDSEILFQILQLILTHLIKEYNIESFKQKLQILLNSNLELAESLFDIFTQKKINKQISNRLLPYNIQKIKEQFKQKRINILTNNFSSFLSQNYLIPCQKKKCKFPKYQLETKFKGQYICLICQKKMCSEFCGKLQQQNLGNLQRHSKKRHLSKSVFLDVEKSQMILIYSPSFTFMPNTLFIDKIGDSPIKGPYQLQYYRKFILNLKTLDQIFEIIMEEKYLNKLIENQDGVYIHQI